MPFRLTWGHQRVSARVDHPFIVQDYGLRYHVLHEFQITKRLWKVEVKDGTPRVIPRKEPTRDQHCGQIRISLLQLLCQPVSRYSSQAQINQGNIL